MPTLVINLPPSHIYIIHRMMRAGIGMAELGSDAEAQRAVEALNGKEILG